MTIVVFGVAAVYWRGGSTRLAQGVAAPQTHASESADVAYPSLAEMRQPITDAGFRIANEFARAPKRRVYFADMRASIAEQGKDGLHALRQRLQALERNAAADARAFPELAAHYRRLGDLNLYEGDFPRAVKRYEEALQASRAAGAPREAILQQLATLGLASLRRGESENCIECIGPTSCILPISREAVHQNRAGSLGAVAAFEEYLESCPHDLRVRWLLNIAYMTLGEYPARVPKKYLIELPKGSDNDDAKIRFENVAASAGLTTRGPNKGGGSAFDDFTGDGLPDLLCTSVDTDRGAALFVNLGDGKFEDRSKAAGLDEQGYALNVVHADYDNDGDLDVLLLRGAWEEGMCPSLLRNDGKGVFADVTAEAGLIMEIPSESAAWGDFDNDGWVDLYICGEFVSASSTADERIALPGGRSGRLLHNERGRFRDVTAAYGALNDKCSKGCAWGDYNGDGWIDLFVSNMTGPCRLFRNDGGKKFVDVAPELQLQGADRSFSCWFWDFDNDGLPDIFVNDFSMSLQDIVAYYVGAPAERAGMPRLYRNLGAEGFKDVAAELGVGPSLVMGANFGDYDNDGFLDFYLGTGNMYLEYLVPNLMYRNLGGRRFADVTFAAGVGHLQKGHGISFADFDRNGFLDLFVEVGGGVPGDRGHNVLFRNPGNANNFVQLKLIGVHTNRSAFGAKVKATIRDAGGKSRTLYRTVGQNGSFGGNSLTVHLGLAEAKKIDELVVEWPATGKRQSFRDVAAGQRLTVTEGDDRLRPMTSGESSAED